MLNIDLDAGMVFIYLLNYMIVCYVCENFKVLVLFWKLFKSHSQSGYRETL